MKFLMTARPLIDQMSWESFRFDLVWILFFVQDHDVGQKKEEKY